MMQGGGCCPPHTPSPGSLHSSFASTLAPESKIVLFFSKSTFFIRFLTTDFFASTNPTAAVMDGGRGAWCQLQPWMSVTHWHLMTVQRSTTSPLSQSIGFLSNLDPTGCVWHHQHNFNTFARWVFLRLPRSCRVAEKSDPIDRFSGPDRRKSREIDGFYRISRRRDTIEPNKKIPT